MDFPVNDDVQQAIRYAQNVARQHMHAQYSPGHLLWAMLKEDIGLHPYLAKLGKDPHKLRSWAQFRIDHYPKSAQGIDQIEGDDKVEVTFKAADDIRKKNFDTFITPLHLLEAIARPHVAFNPTQLKRFAVAPGEALAILENKETLDQITGQAGGGGKSASASSSSAGGKYLLRYCDDMTAEAQQGHIDPVIGRELEMKKLVEILAKRNSPNVLIVGEPGVGKTAIVGGLALNILEGRVPQSLQGAAIYELDTNGRLVAGAYKGEVEERLKNIIKEIKEQEKAILFIDEIHALLDEKGSVGSGAVNLLKPELARGALTVIGATTQGEYTRFIESDEAFNRRFSLLHIAEPNEDIATEILQGLAPNYETYHGLNIEKEAIPQAVKLAKRYVGNKNLPASAIELMDLTMAATRVMNDTSNANLDELDQQLLLLKEQEEKIEEAALQKQLKRLEIKIKNQVSHLLVSKEEAQRYRERGDQPKATPDLPELEKRLLELRRLASEPHEVVLQEDIEAMISYQSGIPLGKLQAAEKEKMQNLEAFLQRRVVGQDHALESVAQVIRRSRAELKESNKPIGVFFFVGPTGTGKTELAKAIADLLFNDEQALIRFDMSEFKEEHSAALLYGAPPGYIGYKEGGLLVNKIRQRPYSVVLFDEIEKAHPSVFDVFLQIVDEGMVTDKLKKKGDFSNAIVIFTSNLGAEWVSKQFRADTPPDSDAMRNYMKDITDKRGHKVFRPEFLARRMDIVPFAPISEKVAALIFDIHLNNFRKILDRQKIILKISPGAKEALVRTGYSEIFGARPIKDAIENSLGTPIAEMIIAQKVKKGSIILLDLDKSGNFRWSY